MPRLGAFYKTVTYAYTARRTMLPLPSKPSHEQRFKECLT